MSRWQTTLTSHARPCFQGLLVLAVGVLPLAIIPAAAAWVWALPYMQIIWYLAVRRTTARSRRVAIQQFVMVTLVFLLVLQLLRPRGVAAQMLGCASEPRPCLDQAKLDMYLGMMQFFWQIDRIFLYLARQIEVLRDWLINEVLTVAFEATLAGLEVPLWYAAAIAWIVFTVSYMGQAFVDLRWVDLRRALRNGIFIVILFSIGSSALTRTEQARLQIGLGFAELAQTSIDCVKASECGTGSEPAVTFLASSGSAADTMATPHSIYTGDHDCDPSTKRETNARFLNDYTANYLWTRASDIHCPADTQGATNLPVVFRSGTDEYGSYGGSEFSGFVEKERIDDITDQGERTRLINLAGAGLFRLIVGLFLSFGSVVEQLIHLVLALSLSAVWFGLLLSLLFAFFLPLEGLYQAQITAMINVFKTSWMTSFWMGLGLALLNMAADSGSGLAVAGVGMVNLCLTGWQSRVAVGLFQNSMEAATSTMGNAPVALKGAGSGLFGGIGGIVGGVAANAVGMGGAYAMWKASRNAGNDRATSAAWAMEGWKNRRQGMGGLSTTFLQMDRVQQQQYGREQNAEMIEQHAQMEAHLGAIRERIAPSTPDGPDPNWDQTGSYRSPAVQSPVNGHTAHQDAPTVRVNPYGAGNAAFPVIPTRDAYPRGATAARVGDDPSIQEILAILRADEQDQQSGVQPQQTPGVAAGTSNGVLAQPGASDDQAGAASPAVDGDNGNASASADSGSTGSTSASQPAVLDPVQNGTLRSAESSAPPVPATGAEHSSTTASGSNAAESSDHPAPRSESAVVVIPASTTPSPSAAPSATEPTSVRLSPVPGAPHGQSTVDSTSGQPSSSGAAPGSVDVRQPVTSTSINSVGPGGHVDGVGPITPEVVAISATGSTGAAQSGTPSGSDVSRAEPLPSASVAAPARVPEVAHIEHAAPDSGGASEPVAGSVAVVAPAPASAQAVPGQVSTAVPPKMRRSAPQRATEPATAHTPDKQPLPEGTRPRPRRTHQRSVLVHQPPAAAATPDQLKGSS